ncbi:hypothetical protein [Synechococcus sp. KORDI-52]|uniref:hypothetical protein n=1 Tax=Synechococcus sp. KORDI-52 TaxID=585425 RepID=UPI0012EC15B3|nr:hypothetical protein [Synechococcus sp. KORDI-52]
MTPPINLRLGQFSPCDSFYQKNQLHQYHLKDLVVRRRHHHRRHSNRDLYPMAPESTPAICPDQGQGQQTTGGLKHITKGSAESSCGD